MMAGKTRPRTASRVAAVQALFQAEQADTSVETVIDEFVRHRLGELPGTGGFEDGRVPDAQVPLFARIVRVATQQHENFTVMLGEALSADWPLERLDPVLRALLYAGAAELWMPDGPPAKVVINEYLDVAHGFFDGEEPRMANGVLDRLAHLLRPREFPQQAAGVGVEPANVRPPPRIRPHCPPLPTACRAGLARPQRRRRGVSPRHRTANWSSPPTPWSPASTSSSTTPPT